MWAYARSIDDAGRGMVTTKQLLNASGMSRQRFWELKELFWDKDQRGRLWIHGYTRVFDTLELDYVIRYKCEFVDDDLKTVKSFRCALYEAFLAAHGIAPIARATIQELTGLSERTQRRYEQQAQVRKNVNYARLATDKVTNKDLMYRYGRGVFAITTKNGSRELVRQLGNGYQPLRTAYRWGGAKTINANLKLHGRGTPEHYDRKYFDSPKAFSRAVNRGRNGQNVLCRQDRQPNSNGTWWEEFVPNPDVRRRAKPKEPKQHKLKP